MSKLENLLEGHIGTDPNHTGTIPPRAEVTAAEAEASSILKIGVTP